MKTMGTGERERRSWTLFLALAVSVGVVVCVSRTQAQGSEEAAPEDAEPAPGNAEPAKKGPTSPDEASRPVSQDSRLAGSVASTAQMNVVRKPTPGETRLFYEMVEDSDLFSRRIKDFQDILDGIVRRSYEQRKKAIEERYNSQVDAEEEMRKQARRSAIEYFERFLKKYPDAPPYTPDAMFRLAELYFEESYMDYLDQSEKFGLLMDQYDEGGGAALPPEPRKDYSRTIRLFEDLIRKYPSYRHIDGAYYLLGYCLSEVNKAEESRMAWLGLVCHNKYDFDTKEVAKPTISEAEQLTLERPSSTLRTRGMPVPAEEEVFRNPYEGCEPIVEDSKFYAETWLRIGEYHFDYDFKQWGLEKAIAAYSLVLNVEDDKFYDEALYKLAWTYFRANYYPEAIREFSRLVDFSDAKMEETGRTGSQMRPEAVQYLAIAFAEEDWNNDQVPDTTSGIERIQDPALMPQDRKWTREVYQQLGQIYFDQVKYALAIQVWELTLQKFPNAPEAPKIQEEIATAYRRNRQFEDEIASRAKLADYGRNSEWWKENEDRPEVQRDAERLAETALYEMALYHHQVAQNLRQRAVATQDAEMVQRAVYEYNLAAQAYHEYLDTYPNRPEAYDLNFNLADAYYYSGQFDKAAAEYAKVRDSNLDDRYREECGFQYIRSLEEINEQEKQAGSLVVRDAPPEPEGDPVRVEPLPIPDQILRLMEAREVYIRQNPETDKAPRYKYNNAIVYYFYGHWDQAKAGFEEIFSDYCSSSEVGGLAWATMVNMASTLNQLDEAERLAKLQQERQCSASEEDKMKAGKEAVQILQSAQFRHAMDKFNEAQEKDDNALYEEAASMLVSAVEQNKDHPDAALALNNAAIAYERVQRFDSATKLFEKIVMEYPKSDFVDRALFRLAVNAFKFFEYEKSLENYLILADDDRFKDSEHRQAAVYNAALLLTYLQSYDKAVVFWKRYANLTEDKKESMDAAFQAGAIYESSRQWSKLVQEMTAFIKRFSGYKEAGPYIIKANYLIYRSYKELRSNAKIPGALRNIVEAYGRYGIEPGSAEAEYAAEANFLLVEERVADFEGYAIKGDLNKIQQLIADGARKVQELENELKAIKNYRRPVWSVAAQYRIGFLYEVLAQAILNIPPPPPPSDIARQIKRLPKADQEIILQNYEDQFRAKMEEQVRGMEDRAFKEYELTVQLAKQGNISNRWTQDALERLNAYKPEIYSLQLPGKFFASLADDATPGLDLAARSEGKP